MWFQPIIDTSGHELVGHECIASLIDGGSSPEQYDWSAIASANRGLYFVSVPETAMARSLRELRIAGLNARDFVFQTTAFEGGGANLVRDCGAALALDNINASSLQRISDMRPDYIKLDPWMTWNAEDPVCACTIRKIAELADRFNVKTIATGVDRLRMMENLWLLGIQVMQGDLLGRVSPDVLRTSRDLVRLSLALEPVLVTETAERG